MQLGFLASNNLIRDQPVVEGPSRDHAPVELGGCPFDALERGKVQLEPNSLLPGLRQQVCNGGFGACLAPCSKVNFRVLLQKHLMSIVR